MSVTVPNEQPDRFAPAGLFAFTSPEGAAARITAKGVSPTARFCSSARRESRLTVPRLPGQ